MRCASAPATKCLCKALTLERNEIILRAGDIATSEDVEALTQIGLLQDEWNWWTTARGFALMLALLAVMGGNALPLAPAHTDQCAGI